MEYSEKYWGPTEGESKITVCSIIWFFNAGLWMFMPGLGNLYFVGLCVFIFASGFVMRGDE